MQNTFRHLLEILLNSAQVLRLQQVQLLAESDWDRERYGSKADAAWKQFNETHELLWKLLLSESASVERELPETPSVILGLGEGMSLLPSDEDDSFESLSFEEQINPANWTEEQWLHSSTFDAKLTEDATLYLQGVALREGFSVEAVQALTRFLSERVKLPPNEPPFDFGDFTPTPSEE